MDWTDVMMELSAAGRKDLCLWVDEQVKTVIAEREACAKVCEEKHANGNWKYDTREECAEAIRMLSNM